jgi:hypothetical protein
LQGQSDIQSQTEDASIPGSAGCQPAFAGSLPTKIVFGRLPNTAGKLPALPSKNRQHD